MAPIRHMASIEPATAATAAAIAVGDSEFGWKPWKVSGMMPNAPMAVKCRLTMPSVSSTAPAK